MSKKIVLYSAVWCGPCKMYKPVFEKLAETHANKAEFLISDIDADDSAAKLRIRGVPTAIVFDGDQEVSRASGVSDIITMLNSYLGVT